MKKNESRDFGQSLNRLVRVWSARGRAAGLLVGLPLLLGVAASASAQQPPPGSLDAGADSGTTSPNPPPPPTVNETNTTAVIDAPVDGAPAGTIVRATRVDASGRRSVQLIEPGGASATLVGASETSVLATGVKAFYASGTILVCADVQEGSVATWRCGAHQSGQSTFANVVDLPGNPHAFLHDVCVNAAGSAFTLLFRRDNALIGTSPAALSGAGLFESLVWNSPGAGFVTGSQKGAVSCDELDGNPCPDPCFVGTGRYVAGACDTTGLAPACTSSDPNTEVYCTGDPTNLCVTYTP